MGLRTGLDVVVRSHCSSRAFSSSSSSSNSSSSSSSSSSSNNNSNNNFWKLASGLGYTGPLTKQTHFVGPDIRQLLGDNIPVGSVSV